MSRLLRWLPSRRWLFLPPLLIGVGTVAILASSRKEVPRLAAVDEARPLSVIRVRRTSASPEITGFGTARPTRTWSATAEVGGRITAIHPRLRSGVHVAGSEVLVQIDRGDYELRVEQCAAELAQAQANVEQLRLQFESNERSLKIQKQLMDVRQLDVERLKGLRDRSGSASESEFEAAMASYLQQSQTVQDIENTLTTFPAQLASATASVSLAESRLTEAKRDVQRTTLTAPFDGLLSGVSLEVGQYVAPNERLFEVLDASTIEIDAQFSIAQLMRVVDALPIAVAAELRHAYRTDQPADAVIAKAGSAGSPGADTNWIDLVSSAVAVRSGDVELRYPAEAIRISDSLDEQTRTLGIVVQVNNPKTLGRQGTIGLRPGTYCEVILTGDAPLDAFLVPRTSLDRDSVLVVDAENRLRRQAVQVAFSLPDRVAVASGLAEGDMVVVNPPPGVMEGDLVDPRMQALSGEESRP